MAIRSHIFLGVIEFLEPLEEMSKNLAEKHQSTLVNNEILEMVLIHFIGEGSWIQCFCALDANPVLSKNSLNLRKKDATARPVQPVFVGLQALGKRRLGFGVNVVRYHCGFDVSNDVHVVSPVVSVHSISDGFPATATISKNLLNRHSTVGQPAGFLARVGDREEDKKSACQLLHFLK